LPAESINYSLIAFIVSETRARPRDQTDGICRRTSLAFTWDSCFYSRCLLLLLHFNTNNSL